MESKCRNIGTTSGASEPQGSAVVSGAGVYTGFHVAGSPRSSSDNREGTGVVSLAPATLNATSAVTAAQNRTEVVSALRTLKKCLSTQEGGLKLLTKNAKCLETLSVKVRSPDVKKAIEEVLSVIQGIAGARDAVISGFNDLSQRVLRGRDPLCDEPTSMPELSNASSQTEPFLLSSYMQEIRSNGVATMDATTNTDDVTEPRPKSPRALLQRQQQKQAYKRPKQQKPQQEQQREERLKQQKEPQQQQKHKPRQQKLTKEKEKPQQQQPQQQQRQQQVQEPVPQHEPRESWSEVVRKGRKTPAPKVREAVSARKLDLLRRRAPKTAAVTIDRPAEGASLAEVMKKVARSVDLVAMDVKIINTRRTRAGGILLEVAGEEKAVALVNRLSAVVGTSVRVKRTERRTPILLLDIPDWAEEGDVREGLIQAGVSPHALNDGPGKIHVQKRGDGGALVARTSLPYKDAIAVAKAGRVTVCWTRCRVRVLENALPTCFRCQEKGHLSAQCKGEARARRCYRCNGDGHLAKDCREQKKDGGGEELVARSSQVSAGEPLARRQDSQVVSDPTP